VFAEYTEKKRFLGPEFDTVANFDKWPMSTAKCPGMRHNEVFLVDTIV